VTDNQPDDITQFQELLTEAYDVYRNLVHKRNPSDAQWAKYLGVKSAAFNHWVNDNRKPNLISVLQLSRGLAKLDRHLKIDEIDQQFRWRVFDVLGMERVHIAPNSDLEYLVDNWDIMPADLKNDVLDAIKEAGRRKGRKPGGSNDESESGQHHDDTHTGFEQ
jgi:hypothetical protein